MSLLDKFTQLKSVLGIKEQPKIEVDETVDILENTDDQLDPVEENTSEFDITEMEEVAIDSAEKQELDDEYDEGYLQYSAEVVGYGNRELQWNAYRTVMSYIDSDSVIDFGCARGDLQAFYRQEFPDNEPLDYVGVESNKPLIEAGLQIYPGINIIDSDWFNLDSSIQRDWAVNIGSCNLRYDTDLTINDIDYTKNTIKKMYDHCTRGVVVLLTSDISGKEDGLINHNPGEFINWAQKEFSNAALDHSSSDDAFCLIIYK